MLELVSEDTKVYFYFLYNCSLCYFSSYYEYCFCKHDEFASAFGVNHGLYCCQTNEEQCGSQYSDVNDVTCTGEVLNLTQQCHNECNFYGFDENRNWGTTRSYLDICQDNRYEFKSQFLSMKIIHAHSFQNLC